MQVVKCNTESELEDGGVVVVVVIMIIIMHFVFKDVKTLHKKW